jgi:hypothetical protein
MRAHDMKKDADAFVSDKKIGNFCYSMNTNNRVHKFYTIHNQSFENGSYSAGSKATSRKADSSWHSSAEIKSGWSFTSTSLASLNCVYGDKFDIKINSPTYSSNE